MKAKKPWKILIVDDEIEQLRTLRLALRMKGYECTTVLNAKEALKALDENTSRFDMVLTDYSMSGMNGWELSKIIRKEQKDLFVILMTAFGNKETLIDALPNQVDGFIEKPFDIETLTKEIERVILKKRD